MEVEVAQASDLRLDGSKVQARVNGRYVSIFNVKGELYCIDAICYHAGGPLTVGDIEDVDGKACVRCPWHNYIVTVQTGEKLYQKLVKTEEGKLVPGGWDSVGQRQRTHRVFERSGAVFVVVDEEGSFESDKYSSDEACGRRLVSSGGSFGNPKPNPFGARGAGGQGRGAFLGMKNLVSRVTSGHLFGADGKMPFKKPQQ
ncbi:Rieske domain-containing protein [Chloropicon primus]|uniref:Rieske domain-containing protein n=1 Tax=Chloropicon primus TaxID=1764295 RepID=A0A5B8MY22_9CHLO|nr:hypothetical protein A3770_17p80270 [Chloropicon primus]UPR04706.1 Rieske domain-containing protein [Chloropicon primus]|mmetsp:Transcript_24381/g.52475  ORF Transcript_24381/g.52475 Transcript_24381/m.52475 type:complete len:200 (+) Transcript_24381:194-793(+)|eukprot:QDZ25509.1 hypothetical protein A3770_17p80270 [Chloropicon primus]